MNPAPTLLQELLRRPARDDDDAALRAAAAGVTDWPAVIDEARRDNLLGLLAAELEGSGSAGVPDEARVALRAARTELAQRGLAFGAALLRILAALERHEVAALPYKGPVLSLQAYGDPGLRRSCDLDILVARDDVARAARTLAEIGYAPREEFDGDPPRALLATECEATFVHAVSPPLEIHWRVLPGAVNRRLDLAALLPDSAAVSMHGRPLRAPGVADTLILQAAHGWKHGWLEIEAIAAMAHLVACCDPATLDDCLHRARALHFEQRLLLAIALAEKLSGVHAEGAVATALADARVGDRAEALAALHRSPGELLRARRDLHVGRAGWQSDTLDGRADTGLSRIQRVTWPSVADRESLRLPESLWWGYWIVRPPRIARDALRGCRAARRAPARPPEKGEPPKPREPRA